jgi:hypothetical protein
MSSSDIRTRLCCWWRWKDICDIGWVWTTSWQAFCFTSFPIANIEDKKKHRNSPLSLEELPWTQDWMLVYVLFVLTLKEVMQGLASLHSLQSPLVSQWDNLNFIAKLVKHWQPDVTVHLTQQSKATGGSIGLLMLFSGVECPSSMLIHGQESKSEFVSNKNAQYPLFTIKDAKIS